MDVENNCFHYLEALVVKLQLTHSIESVKCGVQDRLQCLGDDHVRYRGVITTFHWRLYIRKRQKPTACVPLNGTLTVGLYHVSWYITGNQTYKSKPRSKYRIISKSLKNQRDKEDRSRCWGSYHRQHVSVNRFSARKIDEQRSSVHFTIHFTSSCTAALKLVAATYYRLHTSNQAC